MEVGQGPNWGCSTKEKKKREDVIVGWRNLHNWELLLNLYPSPNVFSTSERLAEYEAWMGK
jgi:hypothetical protein